MAVRDVRELTVYIKAYRVAMDFFERSVRCYDQCTTIQRSS